MSEPILRGATAEDLPRLTALYNHYVEHTAVTFDIDMFSVDARREWFDQFADEVIGYACSTPLRAKTAYRPSVETSIYLDPEDVGERVGTLLYAALLDSLGGSGVHRAYGLITIPNAASIRLHEKLGYREVGRLSECGRKFERWWDVALFERGF